MVLGKFFRNRKKKQLSPEEERRIKENKQLDEGAWRLWDLIVASQRLFDLYDPFEKNREDSLEQLKKNVKQMDLTWPALSKLIEIYIRKENESPQKNEERIKDLTELKKHLDDKMEDGKLNIRRYARKEFSGKLRGEFSLLSGVIDRFRRELKLVLTKYQ